MPQPTRPESTIPTTTRSLQGPVARFMQVIWVPGLFQVFLLSCIRILGAVICTSTKYFLISESLTEESAQGFAGTRRISSGRRSRTFTWLLLNGKSTEAHPFDIWKGLACLLKPDDLYYSTTRSIRLIKKWQGSFDGRRKRKVSGGHDKGPALTGQQRDGRCTLGAQPSPHHQAGISLTH